MTQKPPSMPPSLLPTIPQKKVRNKWKTAFIVVLGILASIILCFVIIIIVSDKPKNPKTSNYTFTPVVTYTSSTTFTPSYTYTYGPSSTITLTATRTLTKTSTSTASRTPTNTTTPKPTKTLTPTITPIPPIFLEDIYSNFVNLTPLQFSQYRISILGRKISENVTIYNVDEDGIVTLSGSWNFLSFSNSWDYCVAVINVPTDEAIKLSSGSQRYLNAGIYNLVGHNSYFLNCETTLVLNYINFGK